MTQCSTPELWKALKLERADRDPTLFNQIRFTYLKEFGGEMKV